MSDQHRFGYPAFPGVRGSGLPLRPGPLPTEDHFVGRAAGARESGGKECAWCERAISFVRWPLARKCLSCDATKVYCVSCDADGCTLAPCTVAEHDTCWKKHVRGQPPRKQHEHQQAKPLPSLFVDAVLHSERDEQRLERLHRRDRLARWFAVKAGKGNADPELWLYDRFIRVCDPDRTGNKETEHHYPTFVSFVGNTTAGKSTIVRAMLLLGLLKSTGSPGPAALARRDSCEEAWENYIGDSNDVSQTEINLISQIKKGEGGEMPVPRSGNVDHKTQPTTFGVHLYRDQAQFNWDQRVRTWPTVMPPQQPQYPLLLADCEGFLAGTAITNAEKLAEQEDKDGEHVGVMRKPITARCYGQGGKDGIDLFYARVLYAISDVVVFVTKGDTIKPDLIKVLEWASAAVDKSYNQPSRKTLIIVRNMDRDDLEAGSAGNERLERLYLRNFEGLLWKESKILASFVDKHNSNVQPVMRISNNQKLYDSLFQKIHCCYIPDKSKNDAKTENEQRIFDHLKILRTEIEIAAREEQILRSSGFAQYNVPVLSHILTRVFEHFRQSENPLNFFLATRRDNPTPTNIAQHVANFLRLTMDKDTMGRDIIGNRVDDTEQMIVTAIALMFLIHVRRVEYNLAHPVDLFDHSLRKHLNEGLDIYLNEYEQCSYTWRIPSGKVVSCSIRGRRYGHKMHAYDPELNASPDKDLGTARSSGSSEQSAPIRPPATKSHFHEGEFYRLRSWSAAEKEGWAHQIRDKFEKMYHAVFNAFAEGEDGDEGDGAAASPDELLSGLREDMHRGNRAAWSGLQSSKTCLACIQSVPDHVMPCGHSYCPRCVQEIARPSALFECAFELASCWICGWHSNSSGPHRVQLKPRCAGARILTLDGGGIRGIVELALLAALKREVRLDVNMNELFDLVVGTSTGGIIALALVMSDSSLENMTEFFTKASRATFGRSKTGFTNLARKAGMLLGQVDSQYSAADLKIALTRFFGEDTVLFAPAKTVQFQSTTRVAVATAKDGGDTECLIANYNRPLGEWTRFEREDDTGIDMKVWEAALATSAAPFYLPPFKKASSTSRAADYVDGAVYANCPAKVAIEEKDRLWPDKGASLDVLLSLGTGHQGPKGEMIPRAVRYGFFRPILRMFQHQLDSNRIWDDLERNCPPGDRSRLHRINPPVSSQEGKYVELDHHREMGHLLSTVEAWTKSDEGLAQVKHVVDILIANLFFFEPDPALLPQEGSPLTGSIRCRLRHGSEALAALRAQRVVDFWHATASRDEVCKAAGVGSVLPAGRWRQVLDLAGNAPASAPSMAVEEGGVRKFRLSFRIASDLLLLDRQPGAWQVLAVRLKGVEGLIPISGFPATLAALNKRAMNRWLQ